MRCSWDFCKALTYAWESLRSCTCVSLYQRLCTYSDVSVCSEKSSEGPKLSCLADLSSSQVGSES